MEGEQALSDFEDLYRAQRERVVQLLAGVAASVALIAVLVVAARIAEHYNTPSTARTWTPPGVEFPLTDLGPAIAVPNGPSVEELTRQVGVDGHPAQVIATSLSYSWNDAAIETVCTSERGSSGCQPAWFAWALAITSSVDNGFADYDLWTVEGLPAGTAFVSYADGNQVLWQRPIMGFVAFPNVAGSNEVVIAYDSSGAETGRYDAEQAGAGSNGPALRFTDPSSAGFNALNKLTRDQMSACLVHHRGNLHQDVASFPEGVDQRAVWTECVATVQQIVADAVRAINPVLYDAGTDPPSGADGELGPSSSTP